MVSSISAIAIAYPTATPRKNSMLFLNFMVTVYILIITATAIAPNQPATANTISVVSNTFFISSYLHLYYM